MKYSYTGYFENEVLRKRNYLKKEWCIDVINNPLKIEKQDNGRIRFWGVVEEVEGKFLRVVTLSDKVIPFSKSNNTNLAPILASPIFIKNRR